MCLRRAPEKYIAGAKASVGAALDRAGLELQIKVIYVRIFGNDDRTQNCIP
jgi:hypothetical protein